MKKDVIKFDTSELKEHGLRRIGELNPYITLLCDLRCSYCYMFDYLSKKHTDLMSPDFYYGLVNHFVNEADGLDRHTFLGGEPTLHPFITEFVKYTAALKIAERRMTTNGTSLHKLDVSQVPEGAFDHVSISIDGITSETNNKTRGNGTFKRILDTMKKYREAGIRLSVNYTVNAQNMHEVLDAPDFFEGLGVDILNFHVVSNIGNAKNQSDNNVVVNPIQWVEVRNNLIQSFKDPNIIIRVPYMYLSPEEIVKLNYRPIQEQNYHSPDGGYRLIVFPPTDKGKGLCYMSADLIGTEGAHIATVDSHGLFTWNDDPRNEWNAYLKSRETDISSAMRGDFVSQESGLKQVSISFKKTLRPTR